MGEILRGQNIEPFSNNSIAKELISIKEEGWRNFAFNQELEPLYRDNLIGVSRRLVNCTDERHLDAGVSIVGIGANFVNRAVRLGNSEPSNKGVYSIQSAISFVGDLQDRNGWGPIFVHNDFHFKPGGNIGCAYLDKLHLVNGIVDKVMGFQSVNFLHKEGIGKEIYQSLITTSGVEQITLEGDHQKNSPLIINEKTGTSVYRRKFEGDNSPFVCDVWIVNQQVVDCYNRDFHTQMTVEDLKTEIVFEHLAVLKILGRDLKGSVVHIQDN